MEKLTCRCEEQAGGELQKWGETAPGFTLAPI